MLELTGTVKTIVVKKAYGFVRHDGVDYFFHKDDCTSDWNMMVDLSQNNYPITVRFNPVKTPKGPRAANITVVYSQETEF